MNICYNISELIGQGIWVIPYVFKIYCINFWTVFGKSNRLGSCYLSLKITYFHRVLVCLLFFVYLTINYGVCKSHTNE